MEEFKRISAYPDYDVSTAGVVRSWKNGKPVVLTQRTNRNGYLCVNFRIDGKTKIFKVHRLVAQAFISNPENKPEVNHINGDKTDNRVENLEWCTRSENLRHAYATGLKVALQGENNGRAKLTNEQARYIRDNPDGLTTVELAQKFCSEPILISLIQRGKSFKNVGGNIRKAKYSSPRIDDETRSEIRRLYAQSDISKRALAKQFGISQSTVRNIIHEGSSPAGNPR